MAKFIKNPKCTKCGSDYYWRRMHDIINKKYYWECFSWIVTYNGSCATGSQLCGTILSTLNIKKQVTNF